MIASRLNVLADTTQGFMKASQEYHPGEGAFRLSEDAQFLFVFPTSLQESANILCTMLKRQRQAAIPLVFWRRFNLKRAPLACILEPVLRLEETGAQVCRSQSGR